MYAGHLPTMRFSAAQFTAMHDCSDPKWLGMLAPTGWSRWPTRNRKVIAVFIPEDDIRGAYAVRPIVRVPMRRAA